MKKFFFSWCLLLATCTGFAQLNASFAKDTLMWQRLSNGDFTSDIKITVMALNTGETANKITVGVPADAPPAFTGFPAFAGTWRWHQ
jgi:hypothetical protein